MATWKLTGKLKGEMLATLKNPEWSNARKEAGERLKKSNTDGKEIKEEDISRVAINLVISDMFQAGVTELGLKPASQPLADISNITNTSLTLKFNFAILPEFELGDLSGIHMEAPAQVSASDEDVEVQIDSFRQKKAAEIETDEPAQIGDIAVMDYRGRVGFEYFEGGSDENCSLELGSHSFIPGFEEQIVGRKAGENFSINVTFPKQYAPELAGKDAVFEIVLKKVKRLQLPELNDEFVKSLNLNDINTVDELRETVKKQLMFTRGQDAELAAENKLVDDIIAAVPFDLADEMIEEESQNMLNQFEQQIQAQGVGLEQYYEMTGSSKKKLMEGFRADAVGSIKIRLIMEKIAIENNIQAETGEIEAEYKRIADGNKVDVSKIKEAIPETDIAYQIRINKAFDTFKK